MGKTQAVHRRRKANIQYIYEKTFTLTSNQGHAIAQCLFKGHYIGNFFFFFEREAITSSG